MNGTTVDHKDLYRFPWTLTDNAISWLEPTAECNLQCDGCYRENIKGAHKSLDQVKSDLDVFQKLLLETVNEPDADRRKAILFGSHFTRAVRSVAYSSELSAQCLNCLKRCPFVKRHDRRLR